MEQITILIPIDRNRNYPIEIQGKLLNVDNDGRNNTFIFRIDSVQPKGVEIPTISPDDGSDPLKIISDNGQRNVSFWRIRENGNNYDLKTYPNAYEKNTDRNF